MISETKIKQLTLFANERENAMKKLAKEYWYDKLIEESELWRDYVPKNLRDDFGKYVTKRKGCNRYKYLLFTINFTEGTDVGNAVKKVEKCVHKKWIKSALYCFEWRGSDNGFHCHLRCEIIKDKNAYRCKGEVYNTFKHMVGNKMHVNLRYSNSDNAFVDYVKGLKKGKPKANCVYDDYNRDKYGLLKYYEFCTTGTKNEYSLNDVMVMSNLDDFCIDGGTVRKKEN